MKSRLMDLSFDLARVYCKLLKEAEICGQLEIIGGCDFFGNDYAICKTKVRNKQTKNLTGDIVSCLIKFPSFRNKILRFGGRENGRKKE